MNILFICTSNKDRSPALVNWFEQHMPEHSYRSAGMNRYFCEQQGTHLLTEDDCKWSDIIVFSEHVHHHTFQRDYDPTSHFIWTVRRSPNVDPRDGKSYKGWMILRCGEYDQGDAGALFLKKAEEKVRLYFEFVNSGNTVADNAALPDSEKLARLKEAKGGSWYDGWKPYCVQVETKCSSPRMVECAFGFKCPECGNIIGWDCHRLLESPLNGF